MRLYLCPVCQFVDLRKKFTLYFAAENIHAGKTHLIVASLHPLLQPNNNP